MNDRMTSVAGLTSDVLRKFEFIVTHDPDHEKRRKIAIRNANLYLCTKDILRMSPWFAAKAK